MPHSSTKTKGEFRKELEIKLSNEAGITATPEAVTEIRKESARIATDGKMSEELNLILAD